MGGMLHGLWLAASVRTGQALLAMIYGVSPITLLSLLVVLQNLTINLSYFFTKYTKMDLPLLSSLLPAHTFHFTLSIQHLNFLCCLFFYI